MSKIATVKKMLDLIKDNFPFHLERILLLNNYSLKQMLEDLEQAQKQEKLLELYKEHFRLSSVPKIAFNIMVFNRLQEIKNEIEDLEK